MIANLLVFVGIVLALVSDGTAVSSVSVSTSEVSARSTVNSDFLTPSLSMHKTSSQSMASMSNHSSARSAPSSTMLPNATTSLSMRPVMSTVVNKSSTIDRTSTAPTTSPPPTSSAMPTTTTPKPPPAFPMNFTLQDKNGTNCLWFAANASLTVKYQIKSNLTTKVIPLSGKGHASAGICSDFSKLNQSSSITMTGDDWSMMVTFKMTTDQDWIFDNVAVSVKVDKYLDLFEANYTYSASGEFPTKNTNGALFKASKGHRYTCAQKTSVGLRGNDNSYNMTIDFVNVDVQPFENGGAKTNDENSCPQKETQPKSNSIVPIAVGCALAGLIVIVLIAYLIGRKKSDSRGYQQV